MDKELHLKLTVRLYTDDNQRCFGPGIATLLERVRERRAAIRSRDSRSYRRSLRVLRNNPSAIAREFSEALDNLRNLSDRK